ncbi:hypothetical protein H9P43_009064 [Blastocladiella emersonii ATCC 22665]|nr:hypothetical protein H9P43_009064 [Blastocladiella emersonii ATCC 22665]
MLLSTRLALRASTLFRRGLATSTPGAATSATAGPAARHLTPLPSSPDVAAIQYDLATQRPAYLHLPASAVLGDSDSASTPVRVKLYPDRPIHGTLLQVAREVGAADVAVYTTTAGGAGPAGVDKVRWCRSTPTLDVVREGMAAPEMAVELKVGKDKVVAVELPSFTERTRHLTAELAAAEPALASLAATKTQLDAQSLRSANLFVWGGLGFLCAQWGLMARLTWWEYSWDVMEPISYFLTFGTGIASYMFYVVTRREYSYEVHSDLHVSARQAALYRANRLDIDEYIRLRDRIQAIKKEVDVVRREYGLPAPPSASPSSAAKQVE